METERIDHIGKILRRFLTRGETVNWDELRVELGKDEYAHVKEELLRMRTMHVGVNRGRIWDKVQESLQQKVKRQHLFQLYPVCSDINITIISTPVILVTSRKGIASNERCSCRGDGFHGYAQGLSGAGRRDESGFINSTCGYDPTR